MERQVYYIGVKQRSYEMGRNEKNLDKLNRLASQRYEDSQEGTILLANDFTNIRNQLECLNSLLKDKKSLKEFIDKLLTNETISNKEYQNLIALIEGIEV
jgi:uncharacterized membrane-anchored protein YhcB (DUF1043 family)